VGDVLDDSLERKLSDEEVSGSLVLSDLSDGDGSRSESVSLLDTSDGAAFLVLFCRCPFLAS
jgi:hypothetical protein